MFLPDITIGTDVFSRQITRPSSSVYGDNNQPLSNPRLLTISHEIAKSGRVSSAVIIDDTATVPVGTNMVADNLRVLVKVTYNPLGGRADLTEKVKAAIAQLNAFLATEANVTKLLNRES